MNEPNSLLRSIFDEAVESPDPSQRAAFLQQACGGDKELLRKVEALLQAHEQTSGPLDQSGVPVLNKAPRTAFALTEKPGDKIGRYKLLEQIGEGGCGVVYVAEQEEPVRRRVALKVLKFGMDTKSVIARFEAERQALALMDHPNIAKVFDAGATHTGRPYFVMELVRGVKITDYCDQNSLPTEERLKLFIQVCNAIQHAHQKGIIHRDIKPSNVLVTSHDGTPVPKVIDFGIAKVTSDQRLTDKTIYTAFEQFIGTPAYMSPEQAGMSGLDIDTRSDIYSLGVLLYELLTGQTPFHAKELLQAGMDEMRRTIREREPALPSTRLSTMLHADLTEIAKHRRAEPGKIAGLIRGDLDWIVMKALEKDRGRRYESITGFAQDVVRYLTSEPVTARPPSLLYLFQKIVRRRKLEFAAASAVAAALIIGLAVSTWLFARAAEARGQVRQRQLLEESQLTRLTARSAGWSQRAWTLASNAAKIRTSMSSADVRDQAAAALAGLDAQRIQHFTNFDASSLVFDRESKRLLMGSFRDGTKLWDGTITPPFASVQSGSRAVAFIENGTPVHLRYDATDHSFVLSDAVNSQDIRKLKVPSQLRPADVGIDPRGRTAMTPDGSAVVSVMALEDGREVVAIFQSNIVHQVEAFVKPSGVVAISSDGSLVAATESEGKIGVWSLNDGRRLATLAGNRSEVLCLALRRSARIAGSGGQGLNGFLAAGDSGGNVIIWDLRSQTQTHCRGGQYEIYSVAFSSDGTILASGGRGPIMLWNAVTGQKLLDIPSGDWITSLAFAPDGMRLAVNSKGFLPPAGVAVWDLEFERGIQTFHALSSQIAKVCFSWDGRRLAALSTDWEVGIWDTAGSKLLNVIQAPHGEEPDNAALAFSPDGERLAFAGSEDAKMWDVESGAELVSSKLPRGIANVLGFPSADHFLLFRADRGNPLVCRIRKLTNRKAVQVVAEIPDFTWPVLNATAPPDARCFIVEGMPLDRSVPRSVIEAFEGATGNRLWRTNSTRTNRPGAITVDAKGKFTAFQTDDSTSTTLAELSSGKIAKTLAWLPSAIGPEAGFFAVTRPEPFHLRGYALWDGIKEAPLVAVGIDSTPSFFPQFAPAGDQLAWGNTDGTVSVCNLKKIKERLAGANLQW